MATGSSRPDLHHFSITSLLKHRNMFRITFVASYALQACSRMHDLSTIRMPSEDHRHSKVPELSPAQMAE